MRKAVRIVSSIVLVLAVCSLITSTAFSQTNSFEQEFLKGTIQIVRRLKEEYSDWENESRKTKAVVNKAIISAPRDPSFKDLTSVFNKAVATSWDYADELIRRNRNNLNNLILTESIVSQPEKRQEIIGVIKDAGNGLIKIKEINFLILEESIDFITLLDGGEIDLDKKAKRLKGRLEKITKDHFE